MAWFRHVGSDRTELGLGLKPKTVRVDSAKLTVSDGGTARMLTMRGASLEVAPGDLVDCYRIDRVLARGGMGVVVAATDLQLDRQVAIKFIRRELRDDASTQQMFREEARAMARIRHENIVTVYTRGEHKGVPYVVMEYVEGNNLADLLERANHALPIAEILRILRPLCRGLDAIHEAGVIHRDIKPSNVLIGAGFRVAITDLGIAQMFEDPNKNEIAGTPAYLAPEVIKLETVTAAADIYALGTLTFELFTGRMPFAEPNLVDLMKAQVHSTPPAPSRFRRDLSPEVDKIVLRALAKDPRERPRTASEFLATLEAVLLEPGQNAAPKTALIIDDDQDMCVLVRRILLEAYPKLVVHTETSGVEALLYLQSNTPSLVITDLRMPGVGGFEITRALRAGEPREVAIIVMTAVGGAEDWKQLASIGANAFLLKPFVPEELISAVGRLFSYSQSSTATLRAPADAVAARSNIAPIPSSPIWVVAAVPLLILGGILLFWSIRNVDNGSPHQTTGQADNGLTMGLVDREDPTGRLVAQGAAQSSGTTSDATTEGGSETTEGNGETTAGNGETTTDNGETTAGSRATTASNNTTKGTAADDEATSDSSDKKSPKSEPPKKQSKKPEPNPTKDAPKLSERCQRIQAFATRASSLLDWNGVLLQLGKKECWPDRAKVTYLKVRALKELSRFSECVAAGKSSSNPQVKAWVSLCEKRQEQ